MGPNEQRIVDALDSVVTARADATSAEGWIAPEYARRLVTRARAAIERYAPPNSAYVTEAQSVLDENASVGFFAEQLCAVVEAQRDDYALGGLQSVAELLHADMFDDFLEIADELHSKGFVAPAAVVAG